MTCSVVWFSTEKRPLAREQKRGLRALASPGLIETTSNRGGFGAGVCPVAAASPAAARTATHSVARDLRTRPFATLPIYTSGVRQHGYVVSDGRVCGFSPGKVACACPRAQSQPWPASPARARANLEAACARCGPAN